MIKDSKRSWNIDNPDLMRAGNRFTTEQAYINRVKLFTSKYEFIGSSDKYLMIMCKDCGLVFNRSKVVFKPSHRHQINCPNCSRIISSGRKKKLIAEINDRKARKEEQKPQLSGIKNSTSCPLGFARDVEHPQWEKDFVRINVIRERRLLAMVRLKKQLEESE